MANVTDFSNWAASLALVTAVLGGAPRAAMAGAVESLVALAQSPTDDQVLVLQYQDGLGGLLFSRDRGATFQIHPSTAFTDSGTRSYVPVMIAGNGTSLVGLTSGLARDDGHGCAFALDPMLSPPMMPMRSNWVTDLARHPTDPAVAFILTSGSRTDASRTGIWRRDASGVISPLQGNDTGVAMNTPSYGQSLFFTKSLHVIARAQSAQGLRFVEVGSKNAYQSATMVTRTPTFRYSDDLGATWTEHTITSAAPSDQGVLIAVTTDDPMKVVVGIPKTGASEPPDLVLLSTDDGASFAPYIEGVRQVGQAIVTPDGRFYLADMGSNNACDASGLWFAPQVGAAAERIVDYPVRCLGYDASENTLYMCKGYEFGRFFPDSRAYCRLMELNDVNGFVACSGTDDLSTNANVDWQLCRGWCGPGHLASSSFCDGTSCVAAARAYDLDAGWPEPPGTDAPSCTGFVPGAADAGRVTPGCDGDAGDDASAGGDDGSNGGTDGGTPAEGGAEQDGAATMPGGDAGSMGSLDGGSGGPRDASTAPEDRARDTGAESEDPMDTDDGCDCSVRAGHRKAPDLASFGLALWLLGQRLRARRRRTDA